MTATPTDRPPPGNAALPPPPALSSISNPALFLDFDGTLVEIAARPGAIEVAPGLPALLAALGARLGGRLAIVSGRAIADLDRYVGGARVALAGSHGGELRLAGEAAPRVFAEPMPETAMAAVRAFAAARPGVLIEDKPLGLAIHYRAIPAAERDALELAGELAARHSLATKRGKMVVELISSGVDKGRAVARLCAAAPFGGGTPVFVGDDVTDEDGFRAAAAHGGWGVLVGPERATAARVRLANVTAVHAWLRAPLL